MGWKLFRKLGSAGFLLLALAACHPARESTAEHAPRRTAVPLFTLGSPGGGPAEFGTVRSVLLDRAGSVYVVDPSNKSLSVFDSTGRFVRHIGREGAGPGEYRDPYSSAWLNDRLALLDPGGARIGVYDSADRWVGSWPVRPITGGQFIRLYRTPPTFWAYAVAPSARDGLLVHYGADGPTDTLPFVRPASGLAEGRVCERPDKGISFFSAPFGAALLEIPTPAGTRALALSTAYRIAFVGKTGDTLSLIEREIPPAAISDAEWELAEADWRQFRREWPTASCDRGEFFRPAAKPPLSFLFYDDAGRLWVEVVTPGGPEYDVFDGKSRLQFTVQGLPSAGGVDPSVAGDRIALVGRDSADVPVVRVFRIPR